MHTTAGLLVCVVVVFSLCAYFIKKMTRLNEPIKSIAPYLPAKGSGLVKKWKFYRRKVLLLKKPGFSPDFMPATHLQKPGFWLMMTFFQQRPKLSDHLKFSSPKIGSFSKNEPI